MNVETLRDYCLSLPLATEDMPFGEETLVFRVLGKIFALIDLDDPTWFCLKCNPDYALVLRDEHAEITPAWHMNKHYWNQLNIFGSLSDELIASLIRHSYRQVVAKMTNKARQLHPEITTVKE